MHPLTPWFADEAKLFDFVFGENSTCDVYVEKGYVAAREEKLRDGEVRLLIRQITYNRTFHFTAFVDAIPATAPGGPIPSYRLCAEEMHKPAKLFHLYAHNRLKREPHFTLKDVQRCLFSTES